MPLSPQQMHSGAKARDSRDCHGTDKSVSLSKHEVCNQFYSLGETPMIRETMPPHLTDKEIEKELVNDSLGTIDTADSTGSEEAKETGDAKRGNTKTRED